MSAPITGLAQNTTYYFRIVAENPEGGIAYGSEETFHTAACPPPTVTKIKPTSGPVAGGTAVTISGTNLAGTTAVKFGTVNAASFTTAIVKGVTVVTAVSPPESPSKVHVTVTTPGGTSATGTKDQFKFVPTVTGQAPNSGSKAGGTSVTVTGSGFALGTTATTFKFGTTAAPAVNCTSSTTCTMKAPGHAVGKVDVKVTVNKVANPKTRLRTNSRIADAGSRYPI